MALGQLLDYERFEPAGWEGGVPKQEPSDDILRLIQAAGTDACTLADRTINVFVEIRGLSQP